MLTLYHNDMSTCAQKVRFALAEKGLDWHGRLRARQGYQDGLPRWFNATYLSLMKERGLQE